MESHQVSFAYYLRQTTRTPLYVQPLCWGALHLKLLRVVVKISPERLIQEAHSEPLTDAASPITIQKYWAAGANNGFCDDDLLPNIIRDILKCVEKTKSNGMSVTVTRKMDIHRNNKAPIDSPRLSFHFSSTVTELLPEIIVTTATTKLPFLLYSTRRHTTGVRKAASRIRWGGNVTKKLLVQRAATEWDIDPFDVACLISMAQEQRWKLKGSAWGWGAEDIFYPTYLVTPNDLQSLCLFTASISPAYLDALEDVEIEITDHLLITREVIPIPSATQANNTLVDRITEILELVYPHHKTLVHQEISAQDGWDLDNKEDNHHSGQDIWGEVDDFVEKMAGLGV